MGLSRIAHGAELSYERLQAVAADVAQAPKKNALATALQEYGRLVKTIFVLRYIEDDALQRRVSAQLNKTEAIHACGDSS